MKEPGPTLEQAQTIAAICERLGVRVPVARTEREARFVIDDLRHLERVQRRSGVAR